MRELYSKDYFLKNFTMQLLICNILKPSYVIGILNCFLDARKLVKENFTSVPINLYFSNFFEKYIQTINTSGYF